MSKPALRLLTIAALTAALGSGCARMPLSASAPQVRTGASSAKAAPVSADALATARKWQSGAVQVGTSIIRAEATDDVATYIFAAPGKTDAMYVVIATSAGMKGQAVPMQGKAAEGVAKMLPLTDLDVAWLDSKDLFKAAAAAGLASPRDLVVLGTKDHVDAKAIALVTSGDGASYLLLDAATGKALSAISRSGERKVQMHELAVVVVVVGAVGTGLIFAAKALISKFWHPKPKPSPSPSDAPTPVPSTL
jgi:hypothetical protein